MSTQHPFNDGPLREAVRHLFNNDLNASKALLEEHIRAEPLDPLGYSLGAAVPFYSFVAERMQSQHGNSLRAMVAGRGIGIASGFQQELAYKLQRAEKQAKLDLAANPRNQNATFALCVAEGVMRDYTALVLKRWSLSFRHAQGATYQARQLLNLNPGAYDAYFVIGFSEHLIQLIPAIVRPFTRIPGIVGQTTRAIQFLEAASQGGYYFQEFARQMLFTLYSEERREQDALKVLSGLMSDFPENEGFRMEWSRRTSVQLVNGARNSRV